MTLTPEEEEIYARQIVLKDIGYDGQAKIKAGRILLLGVGGLGSPTAILLAAMGLGFLRIVDRDLVSRTDLHRQILYRRKDIGKPKVEVAEERLKEINPSMSIDAIPASVSPQNVSKLLEDIDVVLDGLDSMRARYLVNREILKKGIPYVFASAVEMFSNVSTIIPGKTPCLECFYGGFYDKDPPRASEVGVFPPAINIAASVSVSEGLRIVMGQEPKLAGKLLYVDLRNMSFDVISLRKNEKCPVCGPKPSPPSIEFERIEIRRSVKNFVTVFVNEYRKNFELKQAMEKLEGLGGKVKERHRKGFKFSLNGYEGFLYSSGTMTVQGKERQDLKRWIEELYARIVSQGV